MCLIALIIDAKFERKMTLVSQSDMMNFANFHKLKKSDLVLESKMAELNQNKTSKQLERDEMQRKNFILPWK